MQKAKASVCPRCQAAFECKVNDIAACQCTQVVVSEACRQFLSKTQWQDCLCANCLQHFNTLVEQAQIQPIPDPPNGFIENVHYYIDHGRWVFTELYQLQKGYCCGNSCRHCVWGN